MRRNWTFSQSDCPHYARTFRPETRRETIQRGTIDDSDEEWIVETRGSQNTSATNSNRESYSSLLQRPAPLQTAEFHNGIKSNLVNRPRRTRRLPDWTKDYTLNTK